MAHDSPRSTVAVWNRPAPSTRGFPSLSSGRVPRARRPPCCSRDAASAISSLRSALAHAARGRKTLLHRVHHPILGRGIFRNLDGTGRRWSLFTTWFEDPTLERCADVVRSYARAAEIPVTVTAAGEWERATLLADRFRAGRVFLVGDSAHRVTPHGGLGMNTAIQAAHNLAWKLAAVLQGWGGAGLLDTYEVERREAGGRTVDLSYRLFQSPARHSADVLGHVLGLAYTAGAFVPDGTVAPTPPNPVSEYVPAARPANRAPHLWLETARGPRSTLDLFGAGLALLSPAQAWVDAARSVAGDGTAPLRDSPGDRPGRCRPLRSRRPWRGAGAA